MPYCASQNTLVPARNAAGFTLLELMVVVLLLGMVMAVALPQLMPVIVFSRCEGAARHLAGFGRMAMSHATLKREDVTVKFDLDNQVYWAERLVREDEDEFFKDGQTHQDAFMDLMGSSRMRQDQFGGQMNDSDAEADAEAARIMRERLERYVRAQTEARAQKLDKGSLFADMGPLFEKKFTLDDTKSRIEEIKDPLLSRTKLPDGVSIERIRIGSRDHRAGEVEIPLSSLGLFEPVIFHVKNEDDDYFTVRWDPLTGTVKFERGKKDEDDMAQGAQ